MKHLPCPSSSCHGVATLPASAAYPDGEPYLAGQYVSDYTCAKCGVNRKLSPAQYNGLPALTLPEFERLATQYGNKALKDLPTRDLVGQGFKAKHAADLFGAGIRTTEDVEVLARKE